MPRLPILGGFLRYTTQATQPAVTQASPTLFGCRVLAGKVVSGEHLLDGGLCAGRVADERADSLSFSEDALHQITLPAKTADYILTALIHSFT